MKNKLKLGTIDSMMSNKTFRLITSIYIDTYIEKNRGIPFSRLCMKVDITMSHGIKILYNLENEGIAKRNIINGRSYSVSLTEFGKDIGKSLTYVYDKLKAVKND